MSYWRILRRRWPLVVATTLICTTLAAAMTILAPRTYSSAIEFFVSTSAGDAASNAALQSGSTFTQQRVKSYQQLLKTPKALQPAADKLGDGTTVADISGRVAGSIPPDSVLLDVAVHDGNPERARAIADAVAQTFPGVVEELERVGSSQESPVKLTVVKEAVANPTPVSPRPTRNIALGAVLGLLLGGGLAVLRDLLDTKVRTKDDIEELTEATILGGIPFDSDAFKHPLIVEADPHAGRAEAFRSVRTNLQFVDAANHPQMILLTSAIAGEGKSTTTANLAIALAQSGSSVCVVEGDLRRPRVLGYMGMTGAVGVTDVLIGRFQLDDVLQPFGTLSLSVIGAGANPPNPSELLGSAPMRNLLSELRQRFDYVLIDGAPLLPVTDSSVLSALVDGTVLVVGCGIVTKEQVDVAIEHIEAVNGTLLGIVLNRLPRKSGTGYYDYRYEYRSDAGDRNRSRGRRRKDKDDVAPEIARV